MIRPAVLAKVKQMMALPPAQQQQALYDAVTGGVPIAELLTAQAQIRRLEAQQEAQQALQMASQVGGQSTPQTTVAQDLAARAQQLQGIADLPVPESMYNEENYAGGGIVAFQEGGLSNYGYWQDYVDQLRDSARRGQYAEMLGRGARGWLAAPLAGVASIGAAARPAVESAGRFASALLTGEAGDTPAAGIPTLGSTTPARPHTEEPIGPKTSAEAAAAAPASIVRRRTPEAPAKPAEDEELSAYDKRIKDLEAQRDKAQKSYEESIGERPEMLSPEQYQERRRTARERAEKEGGMKSYKERIDEIAAQATQAREDRDTDRWLALAQGFFAMGAGKSRYALQNMAEGLGVTTVQLKDAEKAYRQGEQARKDRIALLEEARRKEALGDVTGAMDDRNRAEQRNADYIRSQSTVRERLLQSTDARISQERAAKEREQTRREGIAERSRLAADRAEDRKLQREALNASKFAQLVEQRAKSLQQTPAYLGPSARDPYEDAVRQIAKQFPELAKTAGAAVSDETPPLKTPTKPLDAYRR